MLKQYAEASAELHDLWLGPGDSPDALRRRLSDFASRRDPRLCTAAVVVAMNRATGGTSPIQSDRVVRIEAVLLRLQAIEEPRRFFVAERINFESLPQTIISRDYLLRLAQALPHDIRMKAALGERAIDDPDLDPGFNGFARDYFLLHATNLFRTADAEVFLRPTEKSPTTWPTWQTGPVAPAAQVVAAAELRPADAESILSQAIDRFKDDQSTGTTGRVLLAKALARLGGEAGLRRAVDVFFAIQPQPGSYGFGREGMLVELLLADPARGRQFVERVVRDPRLTALGPASTRELLFAVHGYLGRTLSDEETIRDSYGIDEFQRDRKFQHLATWHKALQETVDEWSK